MTFDIIPSQSETEDINRVINDQESCIKTYQQVLSLHLDCERLLAGPGPPVEVPVTGYKFPQM